MRSQIGGLPSRRNRINDVRRQERQGQQAADVTVTDAFDAGEFVDAADLP